MGDGMAGRLPAIGDERKLQFLHLLKLQLEDSHMGTQCIPWGSKAFLEPVSERAFSDLLDSRSF